jgi:NADPH-dependent 2,4-dienoyl-CoA reductase/sulfur reductase-like enzyme
VASVSLANGEALPADVVLLGMGSVPNTAWLEGSAVTLTKGAVVCDGYLFAEGVEDVLAVGDVASYPHPRAGASICIEHWTNACETAELAARNLLAPTPKERRTFDAVPTFWSDQYDLKIKSAGFIGQADSFTVVDHDPDKPSMVVEASRGGELVGVVTINKNRKFIDYTRALKCRDARRLASSALLFN